MKRSAVIVLAMAIFCSTFAADWATSQGSCYTKGNMNVSTGVSLYHFGAYGIFDYAIHDAISIGGELGYNGYSFSPYWRYNYFPVAVRGSFHPFNLAVWSDKIPIRNKLDPYLGLAMGWKIGWETERVSGSSVEATRIGGFLIRENIGVRFYPTSKFYLNFEEGGGLGLFNFGVGFNL